MHGGPQPVTGHDRSAEYHAEQAKDHAARLGKAAEAEERLIDVSGLELRHYALS